MKYLAPALLVACAGSPQGHGGTAPDPAPDGDGAPAAFETVTLSVSDISGVRELTVGGDGQVHYQVGTNIDRPDQGKLGSFDWQLPAADLEAVSRAVGALPADLADHRPLMMDDHVSRLRVRAGAERELFFGTQKPVPPEPASLIQALEAIGVASLEHPRCGVRVSLDDAHLDAGGAFRATLRFTHMGGLEATLGNPARTPPQGSTPWALQAWPDGAREIFQGANVTLVSEHGVPAPDALRLADGDSARFELRAQLPGRAGELSVRLMLTGGILGLQGATVPLGDVYAPAVKVAPR